METHYRIITSNKAGFSPLPLPCEKIFKCPQVCETWNVHVGRAHMGFSLGKMNFSGYLLIVTLSGWDATHICPMSAKIQLAFLTSNQNQPLTLEQWDKIWAGYACGLTSTRIIPGVSVGQEPLGFNRKVSRNSVSCGTPPSASFYLNNTYNTYITHL